MNIAILLLTATLSDAPTPPFSAELVFPLHHQHNHAPGIVELPGGDLLVSWYRGSGERTADDVAIYGARKRAAQENWSEPFLMADYPNFPDCNTCMMVDSQQRLWLFWPTIIANTWESCLTNYLVSSSYETEGSPKWEQQGSLFLKPDDFEKEALELLDKRLEKQKEVGADLRDRVAKLKQRLGQKLYQRLGWQPRCKPTVLPSGRILLPLYSDTYSFSLMAVSDDKGATWYAGEPLMGFGNIQPAVLRRDNGTLVAYMREAGPRDKIRVAESTDDGITWGPVGETVLPNPGSGLDGVRLRSGNWAIVYNDTVRGRSSLAVSISDDEGESWRWKRHLERHDNGEYHYPAVIQGADDRIHVAYSFFVDQGKSMKHAAFTEAWVRGDSP